MQILLAFIFEIPALTNFIETFYRNYCLDLYYTLDFLIQIKYFGVFRF